MKLPLPLSIKIMKLSSPVFKYLKNKIKGGEINERGNKYEGYFATFKILEYFNLHPGQLNQIIISSQESSFVDDLLIVKDENRHLYQLKSSKSLAWGSAKKLKTLNFDFYIQKKIERFSKRKFRLGLVVSIKDLRDKLNQNLPAQLQDCTDVVHFPCCESLQKQILTDSKFRQELEKLSALRSPTVDKLESLAATVLGAWNASNKKNLNLEYLYLKVEEIGYAFIKPRIIHNISSPTKNILDQIKGFTYICHGNYLTWEYGPADKGVIPYQIGSSEFEEIEKKIQSAVPKDFITLEEIIS